LQAAIGLQADPHTVKAPHLAGAHRACGGGRLGGIGEEALGALAIDLLQYQAFLFLLGSCFVPLFGVLAADFLLGAAAQVAVRWSGIVAWLAGFALYQWIQPTGPGWWVDLVEGAPAVGSFTGGASLPSFALSFALYAALRSAHEPLGRRRARLAGSR